MLAWVSIHCELKMKRQDLKLEKNHGRIEILQRHPGAKNETKTKPTYEPKKMVLKLDLHSRLHCKNSRNILG